MVLGGHCRLEGDDKQASCIPANENLFGYPFWVGVKLQVTYTRERIGEPRF